MTLPPALEQFIRDNLTALVATVGMVTAVLFITVLVLASRLGKLTRLYRRLTQGTSGGNLEEQLLGYLDKVQSVDAKMTVLEQRTDRLEVTQRGCLQRVGVVRYDAFDDVGGEQSFSVAFTDAKGSGAVLSSVYSRADVRVYAKALHNGQSSHPLSAEEHRALEANPANGTKSSGDGRRVPEGP